MRAFFGRAFESLAGESSYRPFFYGYVLAMSGFWVRIATVGWLVYETTGSRSDLGIVMAASLFPFVVTAPWGGTLADRTDERRLIRFTLLGVVVVNVALGVWLLSQPASFGVLLGYSLLTGALRGMEVPARNALIVRLVGHERVHNVVGLNAASFHMTSVFGPVLAGALYHWFGPAPCFLVVGATALPLAIGVTRLELVSPGPAHDGASVWRDVVEGFQYVLSRPRMRALFGAAATSVLLLWSFRTLMPAVARDVLAMDELGYGVLMGVTGVGSLVGALTVAGGATMGLTRLRALARFAVAGSLAVAGLAVTTVPWLAAIALLAAGFCHIAFIATTNTLVQLESPDRLRARVMGMWALTFGLCFPLGSLVMGKLAEWRDTEFALLVGAGATLACALLLHLVPRRKQQPVEKPRREPDEAEEPGQGRDEGAPQAC